MADDRPNKAAIRTESLKMEDTSDYEDEPGSPQNLAPGDDALPENVLNILLATDIHLGYGEKDSVRGEDSFVAFEEILSLAKKNDVDMILLGGDLFHDSKPSMTCLHKCMSLIRKYCLGDRPVSVEFLSDQRLNFSHCDTPIVNYEDPNLNISIPIFSIHGNHDDPSGFGSTCTLDILSASGLVNYFGKQDDLSSIEISPLLLAKGTTKLALYGLSHVKDARLYRLFKAHKVQMYRPSERGNWFNMLVLHQNRVEHNIKETIPEHVLPDFLDMVFWGHEHGCRVEEEFNEARRFFVTQPGSSVATSLSEDEAIRKKVAILHVHGKKFHLEPLPLQTVRPFVFDSIALADCTLPTDSTRPGDNVQKYVADYLESMFAKVKKLLTGHPKQPTLPLLRLRVLYEDEKQMFNTIRFGQQYADTCANPGDMILQRREAPAPAPDMRGFGLDRKALDAAMRNDEERELLDLRVEEIVRQYFDKADIDRQLQVLSVPGLLEGISQYVDKDDKEAVDDVIDNQIKKTVDFLVQRQITEDNVTELIADFNAIRNPNAEILEAKQHLSGRAVKKSRQARLASDESDDDAAADVTVMSSDGEEAGGAGTVRGRGRGRARGTRAPRGRGRAAAATATKARGKQQTLADAFGNGSGNGSRYGSVLSKQSTQKKGMNYGDSDSD